MQFDSGNLPEVYTDYAARLTYNWDQKYLIEGAGSYAGYNWFAPAQRWAPYWAVGLGWNIHNEKFIKDSLSRGFFLCLLARGFRADGATDRDARGKQCGRRRKRRAS